MAVFRVIYENRGGDKDGFVIPHEIVAPDGWSAERVAQNFEHRHPGTEVVACIEQPDPEPIPA